MSCGCCVVLLDVSSAPSMGSNYGCGIVAYDCCMLGREVLRVFKVLRVLSDYYAEKVCACSRGEFEYFVDALFWGFSWKNHRNFEPNIRSFFLKALGRSLLIVLASKRRLSDAASFMLSKLSSCNFLAIVTDGGREEVRCMSLLSRSAERMGLNVSRHAKYTPFLMIADYVAGLARYSILRKLSAGSILLRDYESYKEAYEELRKRLKGKVYEFI